MKSLVTSVAGLIFSDFVMYLLQRPPNYQTIVNVDDLIYVGNLENLRSSENYSKYSFVNTATSDGQARKIISRCLNKYGWTGIQSGDNQQYQITQYGECLWYSL